MSQGSIQFISISHFIYLYTSFHILEGENKIVHCSTTPIYWFSGSTYSWPIFVLVDTMFFDTKWCVSASLRLIIAKLSPILILTKLDRVNLKCFPQAPTWPPPIQKSSEMGQNQLSKIIKILGLREGVKNLKKEKIPSSKVWSNFHLLRLEPGRLKLSQLLTLPKEMVLWL